MKRAQAKLKAMQAAAMVSASNAKKRKRRKTPKAVLPSRRHKVTRRMFKHAIHKSYGNKHIIARRLGVSLGCIYNLLNQKGWEKYKVLMEHEAERLLNTAEEKIVRALCGNDIDLATNTAKWLLSRKGRDRGYGDESRLKVEGGDRPIGLLSVSLPLEALGLPLEHRKRILEALEVKELEMQTQDPD